MLKPPLLLAIIVLDRRIPVVVECPRRRPLGALRPGPQAHVLHVRVQRVDVLERQALGLVDEEVDKRDAREAAREPDEEDLGLQVGVAVAEVDEVGGGVGDGPVEEPLEGEDVSIWVMIVCFGETGRGKLTLVAVVIDRPLARCFRGKISPVTTHARGPQVEAKKKM